MEFFYSAAVMNYGEGRGRYKRFPNYPRTTKTLTMDPKVGLPFAIARSKNSVWNRVGLHNIGFHSWIQDYKEVTRKHKIIVSLAGSDEELRYMVDVLWVFDVVGIELNFSCPNVKSFENKVIPTSSKHPIYLKLNYKQDPYEYDLNSITGIRLNSVPKFGGGLSGKAAQKYNWPRIRELNREGLNVAGCSAVTMDDLKNLGEFYGCEEIGIGSMVMINKKHSKWTEHYDHWWDN
jgi:hypothetical protein